MRNKCPACYSKKIKFLNKVNLLNLGERESLECQNCNLIFRYPYFKNEDLESYYQNNSFRYKDSIQDKMAKSQALFLNNYLEEKSIEPSKINLLEIGSGNGFFLNNLKKLGFKSIDGIEPDLGSVNSAKKKFNIKIDNKFLDKISLEKINKKYDIIVLIHVLEHMVNPFIFLNLLLKKFPNSIFFIEVPDVKYESKHIKLSDEAFSLTSQHLFSFSKTSFDETMLKSNYELNFFERIGSKEYYDIVISIYSKKKYLKSKFKSLFNNYDNRSIGSLILNLSTLLFDLFRFYVNMRFKYFFNYNFYKRTNLPSIRMIFAPKYN